MGDRSSRSEVTNPGTSSIPVRYDEVYSIKGLDILMTHFCSLASVCAEFVGFNPVSGWHVCKHKGM
jgi:hypothetical protein